MSKLISIVNNNPSPAVTITIFFVFLNITKLNQAIFNFFLFTISFVTIFLQLQVKKLLRQKPRLCALK